MDFSIRDLILDDAASIAAVHVRSWRAGYQGLMDQEFLDAISLTQRTEMWTGILATPNAGARLLAERDGEVLGFVVGVRTSPGTQGAAEVFSIYLDPSAWRGGVGSALLDGAVATLRVDGPTPIILWVVEGNERACGFYEARGWYFDGGRKDDTAGTQTVPHLRYRLD